MMSSYAALADLAIPGMSGIELAEKAVRLRPALRFRQAIIV
jgi:CheY-like chemotaxis protein